MKYKVITFWVSLSLLLLFAAWPMSLSAEGAQQVLIVANTDNTTYQQTIKGFKDQLTSQLNINYSELYLAKIENKSTALSQAINEHKPDLIFAVGSASLKLVSQETSTIPIVSTLIMKNTLLKQANNITGVSLLYPLTIQLQWIKKIFPGKTKISVLYNPDENEQTVQSAKKIAQQAGLELLAIPVETPKQLPQALEQLAKDVQVLLAIPDKVAMSAKTVQAVLLASFRNKVPLIGLSDNWVKSGALYALSWDYADIGQQCAIQSAKLLKGALIQQISMEYPRKVTYTINLKIAQHMQINISDDLRKNAKKIFE